MTKFKQFGYEKCLSTYHLAVISLLAQLFGKLFPLTETAAFCQVLV